MDRNGPRVSATTPACPRCGAWNTGRFRGEGWICLACGHRWGGAAKTLREELRRHGIPIPADVDRSDDV